MSYLSHQKHGALPYLNATLLTSRVRHRTCATTPRQLLMRTRGFMAVTVVAEFVSCGGPAGPERPPSLFRSTQGGAWSSMIVLAIKF